MTIPHKGIILAGGNGSRLRPITHTLSKQLLLVYDKPMIYYPLSTLMSLGIRDILVVTTPQHKPLFFSMLGDGSAWGIHLSYLEQPTPGGIAQVFALSQDFVAGGPIVLILGDNLFYSSDALASFKKGFGLLNGASIFAYPVSDVSPYGAVEINHKQQIISLTEKPARSVPGYAITGLYRYDQQVCDIALSTKPSSRGELEITAIHQRYLEAGQLDVTLLDKKQTIWFDLGTCDALLDAAGFVSSVQKKGGIMIGCPEWIAYQNQWIDKNSLLQRFKSPIHNDYGRRLYTLINNN